MSSHSNATAAFAASELLHEIASARQVEVCTVDELVDEARSREITAESLLYAVEREGRTLGIVVLWAEDAASGGVDTDAGPALLFSRQLAVRLQPNGPVPSVNVKLMDMSSAVKAANRYVAGPAGSGTLPGHRTTRNRDYRRGSSPQ